MSYAVASALQAAVFQHLSADPVLTAEVGTAIYDGIPAGNLPPIYVALGPERVRDASDQMGQGAWHEFTISIISTEAGFATAKVAAGAVSDALVDAPLLLSRGELIGLRFLRARARRVGTGDTRRIDLTFRARVQND